MHLLVSTEHRWRRYRCKILQSSDMCCIYLHYTFLVYLEAIVPASSRPSQAWTKMYKAMLLRWYYFCHLLLSVLIILVYFLTEMLKNGQMYYHYGTPLSSTKSSLTTNTKLVWRMRGMIEYVVPQWWIFLCKNLSHGDLDSHSHATHKGLVKCNGANEEWLVSLSNHKGSS